jgi:hypothetical protein
LGLSSDFGAQQITLAFGIEIDKDIVRRVLAIHFQPDNASGGPSWLTLIGHATMPQ